MIACPKTSRLFVSSRLKLGASFAALLLATPSAFAADYTATDSTTLNNAITAANGDGSASSIITLSNDITTSGVALNAASKPITIDTNGHTYTDAYTDNTGFNVFGAVNLNGTPAFPAGGLLILKGTFQGAGNGASGTGDFGMYMSGASKDIEIDGTMSGGSGAIGGNGFSVTGVSTVTNKGTVTAGNGASGAGGIGASVSLGGTIVNAGTITGGNGANGGAGISATATPTGLVSVTNSGTIQGGTGSTGAGGDGLRFATPGFYAFSNSGTIIGGNGATSGGWGANIVASASHILSFTNSGTIKGGDGGSTTGGVSGAGIIVHTGVGTITNTGTITGGAGGSAIVNTGANVSLINSGTLNAGAGSSTAIFMQGQILTLELDKGSTINGNVVGFAGSANTLILGGDGNASFDVSTIGPQYQNFTAYRKMGNSVWTLTGTGTAATPWAINQGTLQIGDGATVIGDISDNATLAFGNSGALTFANAVTGTGGVTQTGSGRTSMTGASTYSGPTTISAGTLAVNGSITSAVTVQSGGTLGGNGTVGATNVQSGGTVAPGNSIGTLHVNGAFVQSAGSIYQVEVDPKSNASDLILVNGAATIANGATLNVVKNPAGDYLPGAHYTVLTASGGVTGSYAVPSAGAISQFLALEEQQDANDIYLNVVQTGDPASVAETGNQTDVANNLPADNGATLPILNSPSAGAARGAFDALSGEALASARGALVSGSLLVRDTAFDRLRDLCSSDERDGTARPGCLQGDRPLVWVQGFGDWGHVGGNGNAAGISHATGGFLVGTDVPVYDWRVGAFAGFSRTSFDVTARDSWGVSDNYHLGAYGGGMAGDIALKLGASYSWNDLATERVVAIGDFVNDLTAHYNAGTTQIFGEAGESFAFDDFTAEPFANLAYVNLRNGAFREVGGDAALTSRANTMEDEFTTLGVRPAADFAIGDFALEAQGMLGWRHAFGDVTPSSIVSFAGGNQFTVEGAPIARDAAVVEAGVRANISGRAAVGLTYGGQFSGRETDHGLRGILAVSF